MGSDQELILQIQKIRSNVNLKTMEFLKLLFVLDEIKAKSLLDKIQKKDKEVQTLSDLLHMKKDRSDLDILNEIEEIRAQNNTLWMDVVRLCFELDKTKARKIFSEIKECDRKIHTLSQQIADNERD